MAALVLTDTSTEFITLDEVKEHANVTSSGGDLELDLFREAAQEAVEYMVGPVLHRTVTETATAHAGTVLLRLSPVLSVTSVTTGGVVVTGTLDAATGFVTVPVGHGPLTVTYKAGRATVPASIRVAALIIAEHLWKTQKGVTPAAFGEEIPVPGLGYSIPNRAVDLLRPYLLPPTVA